MGIIFLISFLGLGVVFWENFILLGCMWLYMILGVGEEWFIEIDVVLFGCIWVNVGGGELCFGDFCGVLIRVFFLGWI